MEASPVNLERSDATGAVKGHVGLPHKNASSPRIKVMGYSLFSCIRGQQQRVVDFTNALIASEIEEVRSTPKSSV
jgi:hypothetical protein